MRRTRSVSRATLPAAAVTAVAIGLALPVPGAAAPGEGEAAFPACQTQQSLEQVIDSDGRLMPDDCRMIRVTAFDRDGARLCVVDISEADTGVLQALRDAAMPERWWIRCDRPVMPGD